MKKYVGVLALFICCLARGAGFDCAAAATAAEKLICSDPHLSQLDEELATTYTAVLAALDGPNKKLLAVEQRSWQRHARALCDDRACLLRAYDTRITLLHECHGMCANAVELYRHGGEAHNLVTLRDANERNQSFNQDLIARHHAPVVGCETLVDIAVGTAHGNHSFGGLCKVQGAAGFVMVCNDEMLGHFNVVQATSAATRFGLADFTIEHCFGG